MQSKCKSHKVIPIPIQGLSYWLYYYPRLDEPARDSRDGGKGKGIVQRSTKLECDYSTKIHKVLYDITTRRSIINMYVHIDRDHSMRRRRRRRRQPGNFGRRTRPSNLPPSAPYPAENGQLRLTVGRTRICELAIHPIKSLISPPATLLSH